MTTSPNVPQKQDSLFWSLGLPLLTCGLAMVVVLLTLHQKDRWNRSDEQSRTDFRHIPPEYIGYRQIAVFACPIEGQATSFALFGDSTFVIGSADPPMLSFFDDTGTLLRTIDLPEEPRAIVCGAPDTIFTDKIVVAHPRRIVVYSAEGQPETWFHAPLSGPPTRNMQMQELIQEWQERHVEDTPPITSRAAFRLDDRESQSRSLVLTPDYLFVAETGNRHIYRFHAEDFRHSLTFGRGANPGMDFPAIGFEWLKQPFDGFIVYAAPITMTFSPINGLLYIANPGRHRVDVFTQDGIYRPELSFGEPTGRLDGFTACCNPIGLAVLDDGRILTVEKAVSRVKIFQPDGQLDTVVAGADILEALPPGMARKPLDPGGRYFSAVPLSDGRIAVFDFEYATVRIFVKVHD